MSDIWVDVGDGIKIKATYGSAFYFYHLLSEAAERYCMNSVMNRLTTSIDVTESEHRFNLMSAYNLVCSILSHSKPDYPSLRFSA